jgi:hypothetical protein
MKRESQNYQAVSVIAVLLLFVGMLVITIAGLSHAFAISGAGGGSPDLGYVMDAGEPQ